MENGHNEELHNFPDITSIRMVETRRIRWAHHVACMKEKGNACKF
jgi:hypothetical protein